MTSSIYHKKLPFLRRNSWEKKKSSQMSEWLACIYVISHNDSLFASQNGLNPYQRERGTRDCIFSYFSGRLVKDNFCQVEFLLLVVCLAHPFICGLLHSVSWSPWWAMVPNLMLLVGPWISLIYNYEDSSGHYSI